MATNVTISSRRRCDQPAGLRARVDYTPSESPQAPRPPTPYPSQPYPAQQPKNHPHYRLREFLEYRYVSERYVYRRPRRRSRYVEVNASDRSRASVEHYSVTGGGYTQQAMRSKEQELQRSKADQNAKIAHRWGIHYLEENKPNKKVRFAPEVCQGNELTEAVRNLRLDGRSLVDTALKADNRDSPQAWLDALISNAPCVMSWLSKEV